MIKTNAFYILNVTPENSRVDIANAREDALFDGNLPEDVLRKAESKLTKPIPRLQEELSFLWGVPSANINNIVDAITSVFDGKKLLSIMEQYNLHPVTQANIIAELYSDINAQRVQKNIQNELRAIKLMADMQNKITVDTIINLINSSRALSKAVPLVDAEHVAEALQDLYNNVYKPAALNIICLADHPGKFATTLAEDYQFNKLASGRFVQELINNNYKNWIRPKTEPLEREIEQAVEQLKSSPHDQRALKTIELKLAQWDEYVQPMQLIDEGKGFDEKISFEFFRKLRDLSLHLHNKHGASEVALHISQLLANIFPELPQAAESLKADISSLEKIINENKTSHIDMKLLEKFQNSVERIQNASHYPHSELVDLLNIFSDLVKSPLFSDKEQVWFFVRGQIIHSFNKHPSPSALNNSIAISTRLKTLAVTHNVSSFFLSRISKDVNDLVELRKQAGNQQEGVFIGKLLFWGFLAFLIYIFSQ